MDTKDWSLFSVAKTQDGLVTFEQARAVGFARDAMRWRLNRGEWVRVLPSVVRLYWAEETAGVRRRAAVLWAGRDGGLSHFTAARLHGFDVAPQDRLHLTLNGRRRLRSTWCQQHRAMRATFMEVDGLRVTTPARTMLDLATVLDDAELKRVLRLALRISCLTTTEVEAELSRCGHQKKFRRAMNAVVRE